jgi:hypothetical protein
MKETRAYIFSNSAIITNYRIGESVKADLFLKNTGKTPAHDVRFMGKIGVDFFPLPKEPPSPATVIQIGTLGQEQEIEKPSVSSFTLDGTQFHSIESGKAAIYLIGEVTYVDVYGVNCRTKFRLYYGGDNIDANRRMAIYKTGNETGCDK